MKKLFAAVMLLVVTLGAAIPVQAVPAMTQDGNTIFLLDQSAVPLSVTGTTAETTLVSINLPGGLIGPNGMLRITLLWATTNNANVKSYYVKAGGVVLSGLAFGSSASFHYQLTTRNRGVLNSQVSLVNNNANTFSAYTTPLLTTNVNTAVDQQLSITCALAVTTDTCTLEAYTIEIIRP